MISCHPDLSTKGALYGENNNQRKGNPFSLPRGQGAVLYLYLTSSTYPGAGHISQKSYVTLKLGYLRKLKRNSGTLPHFFIGQFFSVIDPFCLDGTQRPGDRGWNSQPVVIH